MPHSWPIRRATLITVGAIAGVIAIGVTRGIVWRMDWTESYIHACETANLNRKWDELGRTSESWTRWNPNEPEAWWFRAQAAEGKSRWEDAVKFLEVIPVTSSRAGRAYLKRTEFLFNHLHRQRDALASCRRILAVDSHNCEAHQWIIFIYAVTLRHADLLKEIRLTHESGCISNESIDYLMRADILAFANSFDLVAQFLTSVPEDETCLVARALLIARGPLPKDIGFNLGDQSELEECLRRYPHNPDVLEFYLDMASAEGDTERVNELLQRFTEVPHQDHRYWYYSGWRHSQSDELKEAEQDARRALELYPFDLRTQNLLSAVLRRLGRADEAEHWAASANRGRALKSILQKIPRASMFTPELLNQIADYAAASGDLALARMIHQRLHK